MAGIGQAYAIDMERDGDLDVLWTASKDDEIRIGWLENFSPRPGDANRDWQFDQLDIVQVLQTGKYLSGAPTTWEEGDWNSDRVFDQLDIVAALQTGNYLRETADGSGSGSFFGGSPLPAKYALAKKCA